MEKTSFLLLVISISVIFQESTALKCVTKDDCFKSLYVTGNCVNNVCECATGCSPYDGGCIKATAPEAFVFPSTNVFLTPAEDFNGQVLVNAYAHLGCKIPDTDLPGLTYTWYFNGAKLTPDAEFWPQIRINGSKKFEGNYQCEVEGRGLSLPKSNTINIDVVTEKGELKRPTITGMPKSGVVNGRVNLRCSDIPHATTLKFEIFDHISGGSIRRISIPLPDTQKAIECQYTADGWKSPRSISVYTPVPTDTLPAVEIVGNSLYKTGNPLDLTCEFKESFAVSSDVKFSWTVNSTVIEGNEQELKSPAEQGDYKCKATYNSSFVESPVFSVVAANTIFSGLKVTSTPKKAMPTGEILLRCDVTVAGNHTPKFSWIWKGRTMGITDNAFKFTNITEDMDTDFTCNVYIAGEKGSETLDVPLTDLKATKLEVNGMAYKTWRPITETTVKFECAVMTRNRNTSGVTYKWLKNDNAISGAISSIHSLEAKPGLNETIACMSTLNGYSQTSEARVIAQDELTQPVIKVNAFEKDNKYEFQYSRLGSFSCASPSVSDPLQFNFSWFVNGEEIAGQHGFQYAVKMMTPENDGNYTCSLMYKKLSSNSGPVVISVSNPNAASTQMAWTMWMCLAVLCFVYTQMTLH